MGKEISALSIYVIFHLKFKSSKYQVKKNSSDPCTLMNPIIDYNIAKMEGS